MNKHKFICEYAINASPKMIYPYLTSPSGLEQWFCDKVVINEDRHYNFIWDSNNHFAEMTNHRTNKSVRFIFLDENKKHGPDSSYMDFTIETSELTQEQYLRVIDYSEEDDMEEMSELWDGLIISLREIIGG
ncbi:START-like domain-containing protein [Adhaeribacter aquaticus]|uniref:START-like domain-containing protein n=1 Tax=Adhaeribacter aquaticus TaxID=299567 RepID=UPI00047A9D0D|nr:START-like domain-containing protein [Adhaeribacter aquaticus]